MPILKITLTIMSVIIVAILFITTLTRAAVAQAIRGRQEMETPLKACTDWSNGILVENCHSREMGQILRELMDQHPNCPNTFVQEVRALTKQETLADARAFVDDMCNQALQKGVQSSRWSDIHSDFNNVFMEEYFDGGTFLNEETGNFKNPGGTDPRQVRIFQARNDYFPSLS